MIGKCCSCKIEIEIIGSTRFCADCKKIKNSGMTADQLQTKWNTNVLYVKKYFIHDQKENIKFVMIQNVEVTFTVLDVELLL